MKIRTKKVLSLLLAASMVLGMNTMAFGDEIAEVADTATVAEDAGAKVAATDASDNGGVYGGILVDKDGKAVTSIAYASNGAKKNAKNNVVTINNTSDPVSWNNFYARNLFETVLFGDDTVDEHLNNKEKLAVSENKPGAGETDREINGLVNWKNDYRFESIPVDTADKVYLLVGYSVGEAGNSYLYDDVKGYDDVIKADKDAFADESDRDVLPVTEWDGRKVVFNKSGKFAATKSQREVLDVAASLVQYQGTTVTEFANTTVKSAKIDGKALKAASVEYKTTEVKWKDKNDVECTIDEHNTMNTVPTFTIKVNLDKSAKKYKKGLKTALKDKKFSFGIMQKGIGVSDPTWGDSIEDEFKNAIHYDEKDYSPKIASSNDADKLMPIIAKYYNDNGIIGERDIDTDNEKFIGGLKINKFEDKNKAKATLDIEVYIKDKKGKGKDPVTVALKNKKDYELKEGSMAGEKVWYLDLPETGNYVYADSLLYKDEDGDYEFNLAPFGFKWAFRYMKDSKGYRKGVYAANDLGFVNSK